MRAGLFGKHTLLAGDVVRLRIDAEGRTQTIRIEIRSGKAPKIVGL